MRPLKYAFDEAAASLWRGRRSATLALATIATALFVLGGFLLLTANLSTLLARWSAAAELSVYLDDDLATERQAAIERALRASDTVSGVQFVSKAEAIRRFRREFADLAETAESLPENPLPASFDVKLRTRTSEGDIDALVRSVAGLAGVADVRYDRQWLERLTTVLSVARGAGLALSFVLIVAAALTVASVVRLALYARRSELEIMQLVGAPVVYIRGPFVAEGILQGGTGALLALAALWIGFAVVRLRYSGELTTFIGSTSFGFLPLSLCVLLLCGGMGVGCVSGWIAARGTREQSTPASIPG